MPKNNIDIVNAVIEFCRTAPELCPTCKHLEDEPLEHLGWGKWCSRLTTAVNHVWLCTAYEQAESESIT